MITVPGTSVSKPPVLVGALLTPFALVVGVLAAMESLWFMPFAGLALVGVGWLGSTLGVPQALAYVVIVVGLVMLPLSFLAFMPP